MPKYLIYWRDNDEVLIEDVKPVNLQRLAPDGQFGYPVWYEIGASLEQVTKARRMLELRWSKNADAKLSEVATAARELIGAGGPTAGYLSLGASPKLLKWWLESKGVPVTGLNISGIPAKGKPGAALQAYIRSKIDGPLQGRRPIVVFDYADSGASLWRVKKDIEKLYRKITVVTVAIGTSHRLKHMPDYELNSLKETTLGDMLEHQTMKETLFRSKPKNKYTDWSQAQNSTRTSVTEQYAEQKSRLKDAYIRGLVEVSVPGEVRREISAADDEH